MAILELKNITKKYKGLKHVAVNEVNLEINEGEILALVGESGSGKTTLLRIIAGLEHPESGSIRLKDQEIVSGAFSVPPNRRDVGLMFQDYALFPHLTLFENISYGLKSQTKSDKESEVKHLMQLVDLQEDWNKYPSELSGGQQQRVALARALAPKPKLLLLDEPFSNLDAILREQVRQEIRQIIKSTGITAIMVTHDTKDALSTADQIAVMHKGKLLQKADPKTIHDHPELAYVAELFGKFNSVPVEKEGACYRCAFGCLYAPQNTEEQSENPQAELFFRPNQVELVFNLDEVTEEDPALSGIVCDRVYVGSGWEILVEAPDKYGNTTRIWIFTNTYASIEKGQTLYFKVKQCHWWENHM